MDLKEAYNLVEKSESFISFRENESSYYLVHAFLTKEHSKPGEWEFGFYNKQSDKIVVFESSPVKRLPEQEVFKKEGDVKPINIDETAISYDEAMQITEHIRREKYSSDQIAKYIVILQYIHKQVWNITLISTAFSIINIRIDSMTGEVISSNKSSISDLGLKQA
ncbi:hypothetical protein K9M18_01590 [Candidatus Woesearchaeota archaeon]|nr:hypothetical protein [Candidatus Woesearchaeota archaeon]MCF8013253.1 hypothetical protein [Candidatus Woesearchaeota archaeon]